MALGTCHWWLEQFTCIWQRWIERCFDFNQVVLPALEHTSGDVRDPASRLVLELYKKVIVFTFLFVRKRNLVVWRRDGEPRFFLLLLFQVKDTVRDYLPPDEPATRKNPLYRNLFDGFDKIDGKPTEAERRVGSTNHIIISTSITRSIFVFAIFTTHSFTRI